MLATQIMRRGSCAITFAVMAVAVVVNTQSTPSASAGGAPFRAHLYASGHHPRANTSWRVTITARSNNGKKLSGRVQYEFVFGGQVVSRSATYRFRNGVYRDVIKWPKRSIGYNLVFRPVVTTSRGTVRLPYGVKVRR